MSNLCFSIACRSGAHGRCSGTAYGPQGMFVCPCSCMCHWKVKPNDMDAERKEGLDWDYEECDHGDEEEKPEPLWDRFLPDWLRWSRLQGNWV